VHFEGSSAPRLFCPKCSRSYTREQVCEVCRTAYSSRQLTNTIYRSQILGTYKITHCPSCSPPSKTALEFKTLPIAASVKYGLIGLAILVIVSFMIGVCYSGMHPR